jgi:probable HAF family extracellular repeat protein
MQRSLGARFLAAAFTAASLVVAVIATPMSGSASAASTTEADGGAAGSNLTVTTHNLGALDGRYSRAEAVSGSVVVGWLRTASGDFHAFAYDLAAAEPVMHDLGTLGGADSDAVAVDGTVVVGTSDTASGERHAFAYDLAAAEPVMQDLGTLGGRNSVAAAVDGTVVVGWADTASGDLHAFAYDLAADGPVMRDLGHLGGPYSRATAVDGDVVVGVSAAGDFYNPGDPEYQAHAFAYDLAADEPVMQDLGTLGGSASIATDVDGDVVVGWSHTTANPTHAFAYDLAADVPVMEDLGTLEGDSFSEAVAVDGGMVVGESVPTGRYYPSAVAYDLAAPEPAMRDFSALGRSKSWATGIAGDVVIGGWRRGWPLARVTKHAFAHDLGAEDPRSLVLGTWRGSTAEDVDGNVVVGSRTYGSSRKYYATAWVLRETSRPMFGFRRFQDQVKEGVGRVRVRVERYGRTDRAVTVRYRTRSSTATAGKDFVSASGKLRFAPGVTSRSFRVKILNDRRAERHEDLVLQLSRPSRPAVLGSPRWTELRIAKNDR